MKGDRVTAETNAASLDTPSVTDGLPRTAHLPATTLATLEVACNYPLSPLPLGLRKQPSAGTVRGVHLCLRTEMNSFQRRPVRLTLVYPVADGAIRLSIDRAAVYFAVSSPRFQAQF